MQCPRCHNTDPSFFYRGSKGWYCRRCIAFSRVLVEEEREPVCLRPISGAAAEYMLRYPLTPAQAVVSHAAAELADSRDQIIVAVTGAGKTELVVEAIACMLKRGRKVCFAIARRQVVLELQQRLQEIFCWAQVIAVCGGHTQVTDGDLIVCTTHQLYRYDQAFDLLILDEPDAFPFRGDPVLHGIAESACRGHRIYLTATPDRELRAMIRSGALVRHVLNQRPHGHPLPVPRLHYGPDALLLAELLHWLHAHQAHPRMVFVPTIAMAGRLHRFLRLLFPGCFCCTSHTEDRDAVIASFRSRAAGIIVATTVLERGVTIPGADICVYAAEHPVFDEAGLIQMAGRAGRSFASPDGDVLFLMREHSRSARRCVQQLRKANASCAA